MSEEVTFTRRPVSCLVCVYVCVYMHACTVNYVILYWQLNRAFMQLPVRFT